MDSQDNFITLKSKLIEIYNKTSPPEVEDFLKVLKKINSTLTNEDSNIRPFDSSGLPGGILYLKNNMPTIIVPDIHARMDLFLNIMFLEDPDGEIVLQKIAGDKMQVVCVGDGVHAEKRAAMRWSEAYKEFEGGYALHSHIDEEMKESFGVMEMIMEVKSFFPSNFHYLKGNHDNITNEEGEGNYPFIKFSYEGPMVAYYVEKFYGNEFLDQYYQFEKNLPLLAIGKNFLISHAEPWTFYEKDKLIEYRKNPDVIEGLTWTADDAANEGSVNEMLEYYIPDSEIRKYSFYFGGHRPVAELYNQRADGKFIQIHNPNKFIICLIKDDKNIVLEDDVIELENEIEKIIGATT